MGRSATKKDKHLVAITRDPYESYDLAEQSELRTVQDMWAHHLIEQNEEDRRVAAVKHWCHEYYTAAVANNLVYSVPHRLAGFGRGWVFGLRVIDKLPNTTQDTFLCATILILPNGRLRELFYTYQQGKPRVYHRFSSAPELAKYSPDTLQAEHQGISIFYARTIC